MGPTPYGYRIKNGKAVVDEQAAQQIRTLFHSYLAGDSLDAAAKKADVKAAHSGIGRILQNKSYLGDAFYPAIIDPSTFTAAEAERSRRAEKLRRIYEPKATNEVVYPTDFRIREGTEQFDDPIQQAEYAYSLIEIEVKEDGT